MNAVDIDAFGDFLSSRASPNNRRRCVNVVKQLASGNGVAYKHRDGVFFQGRALTLDDDIEAVRAQAGEWLPYRDGDPNRIDKGKGWALNHPLKRLFEFKQFTFEGIEPTRKRRRTDTSQHPSPPPALALNTAAEPVPATPEVAGPMSREDRLASYCGNNAELINFARRKHGKTGGMSNTQVRNWLKKNPEYIPAWLKDTNWEVDHIISHAVGGMPWPYNFFIMPKSMNAHFRQWVDAEKAAYVGADAWQMATSFAQWSRNKTRAVVDFSSFDPVGAQFVGRS